MKERYTVLQTLFPNYLIIIKKKDHEITFENDKIILNNIKNKKLFNSTNTIILNNLEIVSKKEYENNNYETLYIKAMLINYLNNMKRGL
jgi:transcriptional regulator NrdR family protein